jgi:hypothetical protein
MLDVLRERTMLKLFTVAALFFPLPREARYTLDEAQGRVEGRQEAERDIALGAMKWKIYGYMAGLDWGHGTYVRRMRWDLGVEVVVVAQCTMTCREHGLWEGYNDRIKEELERRHGPGVVSRVRRDAVLQWRLEVMLLLVCPVCAVGMLLWRRARRLARPAGGTSAF